MTESMRTPGMSNHPSVDLLGMHIGTQPDARTAPDEGNAPTPTNDPPPPKGPSQTVDWAAVMNATRPHTAEGPTGKEPLMGPTDELATQDSSSGRTHASLNTLWTHVRF